jgi:hypothetical protein
MVNTQIVLENYQKVEKVNVFSTPAGISWILLIVGIGSIAAVTGIEIRNLNKKRRNVDDPTI